MVSAKPHPELTKDVRRRFPFEILVASLVSVRGAEEPGIGIANGCKSQVRNSKSASNRVLVSLFMSGRRWEGARQPA